MNDVIAFILKTFLQVLDSFADNWPFLTLSIVIAALMKVYVNQEKVAGLLRRNQSAGVLAATVGSVATPLCSCGTTAVILGMMAGNMPWAPIVAFMVASPLTSPQELIYSAGLFGWPFGLTFFGASILIGLMGGLFAHVLEATGWLKDQARFKPVMGASGVDPDLLVSWSSNPKETNHRWPLLLKETFLAGRQLLAFFFAFSLIGYTLNNLIPSAWVSTLFGEGRTYSVPLAALLGVPLYFNTEASMPLVRSLLDAGMSQGAALAFLITGAGTSIGALAGALTIARWRVVGLVVGILLLASVVFGFAYDAFLVTGGI